MRIIVKILGVLLLLLSFVGCAVIAAVLPAGPRMRRALLIRNVSLHARAMLVLLGIRVHCRHPERLREKRQPRLQVANHVSYIDILVIASFSPAVFVTSRELGGTLFLGLLARLGGSLFVERRTPAGLKREIAAAARILMRKLPVALFPEGTTSNGDQVHAFKNALFDAARMATADIQPICLRYTRLNGSALTRENRDAIYYYGGVTFFQHVPRLLSLISVDVEILPLKLIQTRAGASRKELARQAHDAVQAAFQN